MPGIPLASASEPAAALPAPRAYGATPDDLAIDLEANDRPAVATRLIARCCVEAGSGAGGTGSEAEAADPAAESFATNEEIAWSLPLGARIARLLRIVELTTESDELGVVLTCPASDCRSAFEVSLPFGAIASEAVDDTAQKIVPFPVPEGAALTLRLPTGRDQAQWRAQPYHTPEDAVRAIVQTLALNPATPVPPPIAGIDLAALSAAMEAADPLVAFAVRTTCPHCERAAEIAIDLEAIALRRLRQHQRSLVRTVHVLATRYGWTEAEILSIPPRRRSEYLRLIEDENPALP
jgi:hypothetical protein